jgi:endo-1,4-beta-xylanase
MQPHALLFYLAAGAAMAQQSGPPAAAWLDPNRAAPAGMQYRTFHSRLAGSEVSYLIYLPPDYETHTSQRYPVVYWLHGYGGNPRAGAVFVTPLDAAIRRGKAPAMIVVLVNGLPASFYCDSMDGKWPVDSVIVKDLIPHIDQTYRTIARREGRAVEGFSMGGYGAAHLGFKHPDVFGIVSIRSGAFTDSEEWGPLKPPQGGRRKMMLSAPKAYFEATDLATVIRKNADAIRGQTVVRMAVGSEDTLRPNNQALHEFLTQLKIEHDYEVVPGVAHDSRLVYRYLGDRAFAHYVRAFTCQGVIVHPGAEIQTVVAAHPAGTTYCFDPGIYRVTQTVAPKEGDKLIGSPGAILNGSRLATNWTRKGNLWIATGQTQRSPGLWKASWPALANPTAQNNEDLFIDDRQLKPVLSAAEVVPGKFYFDYGAATIYIADNPAGHHSVIQDNEVRYVHGTGIRFGDGAKVLNNRTHHNGMYGMQGAGEGALVEENEIAFNNTAGYCTIHGGCWAAGGTKFVLTNRLVVRRNYVHHNYCGGLWTDIDNINTTYEENRIEYNYAQGIHVEISYAGVIRNNTITGNMGTGIMFNSSSDQDVYGNTLAGNGVGTADNGVSTHPAIRGDIVIIQQNRGSGRHGERLSKNIYVHDNTITMAAGVTGPTKAQGNPSVFTQNNRFQNNHYYVPDLAGSWWVWLKGPCTWPEWQALGQDTTGTAAQRAGM